MPAFESFFFDDDGFVPNNQKVALRLYRKAGFGCGTDTARQIIAHFARYGWVGAWINGIYDFQHYHATAHEVLGIVEGNADVQLGGVSGPVLRLSAGDAVMIPAGVGHCLIGSDGGLTVVGAYPAGQENYDLKRATEASCRIARSEIPLVALPLRDPVTGVPFSDPL